MVGILGAVEGAATGGTAAVAEEALVVEDMVKELRIGGRRVVVIGRRRKVNDEGKRPLKGRLIKETKNPEP